MSYDVRFQSRTKEVAEQIQRGSQANLKAAAIVWHGSIIKTLQGQRSGYTYPVPGTGRVVNAEKTLPNGRTFYFRKLEGARYYTASAPGEAPASRTGDLRTSYRFQVKDNYAEVGSPLDYALWLEKGTSEMAPRPHIWPAFEAVKTRIESILGANVI